MINPGVARACSSVFRCAWVSLCICTSVLVMMGSPAIGSLRASSMRSTALPLSTIRMSARGVGSRSAATTFSNRHGNRSCLLSTSSAARRRSPAGSRRAPCRPESSPAPARSAVRARLGPGTGRCSRPDNRPSRSAGAPRSRRRAAHTAAGDSGARIMFALAGVGWLGVVPRHHLE